MKIHLEKRPCSSPMLFLLLPILSLILSLLLGAVLLSLFKINPWQTYRMMFLGAFGTWAGFSEVLLKATPLILTGLGVSIAFRMKFWNIGAEGQLIWGGIAAAFVGLFIAPEEGGTLIYLILAILAATAAGALWAGIPALLKTRLKVDETLTTLMMNFIALILYRYLYTGPWSAPGISGSPGSRWFSEVLWLPRFFGEAHIGIFFALGLAVVLSLLISRSQWGFEITMIGHNREAARVMGLNNRKKILTALLLSGALSGLAGGFEVLGVGHRLQPGLASGYGYTAIIVAFMAALNPLSLVLTALILAGILAGGEQAQLVMKLPPAFGPVLLGLLLIPLLGGAVFSEYRIKLLGDRS